MTARTIVSHAAALLLGLLVAGGAGLFAVRHQRSLVLALTDELRRKATQADEATRAAAEAEAEAKANLARALKAEALLRKRDLLLKELQEVKWSGDKK